MIKKFWSFLLFSFPRRIPPFSSRIIPASRSGWYHDLPRAVAGGKRSRRNSVPRGCFTAHIWEGALRYGWEGTRAVQARLL